MENACQCNFLLLETIDNQGIAKYEFEPFSGLYLLSFFYLGKSIFYAYGFSAPSPNEGKEEKQNTGRPPGRHELEKVKKERVFFSAKMTDQAFFPDCGKNFFYGSRRLGK